MVLNRNYSQEFPTNSVQPQGSILGPAPFLLPGDNTDQKEAAIQLWVPHWA